MEEQPLRGGQTASATPRILVVEDDIDILRINTEVLIRSGYQVDAAEDGSAAWDSLQLKRYDLMVTDNDMPKVTGVELLYKLHAAKMALPVIMATGMLPQEEFKRHPWIQPAAVLLKPYTFSDLLGSVKKVLTAGTLIVILQLCLAGGASAQEMKQAPDSTAQRNAMTTSDFIQQGEFQTTIEGTAAREPSPKP